MSSALARPPLLALLALLLAPVSAQTSDDSAWQTIRPGGETTCAFGTPFEFWVREGDSSRILIYLQGGGACWNLETCDPRRSISFDPVIDSTDYRQRRFGIFDRSAPGNPFRGYTQIFVPYCTGDFHLGARVVSYPAKSGDSLPSISVKHLGYRNLQAVAGYVAGRKSRQQRVVVSGGSAGAIASPVLAGELARRLSGTEVIQIGDGVAGIHNVKQARLLTAVWGADSVLRSLGVPVNDSVDLFTAIYKTTAAGSPGIHFSQIATESDAVVTGWLKRFGYDPPNIPENITATYHELGQAGLCFNGYRLAGTDHTMLWRPEFLTARNAGGLLVDQIKREVLETACPTRSSSGGGEAAFLFSYRPRPERTDSFVAGYRRHLDWHAQHRDSLTWLAWNVIDGPDQGLFVDGTFGISFAAFDARVEPAADAADFIRNVSPHSDPIGRETFRLRADLSTARRLEQNRAGAMQKVVRIGVRPGEVNRFEQTALQVKRGTAASYSVYQRVSGGIEAEFMLVLQLDGWADFRDPALDPSVALLGQAGSIEKAESSTWLYQPRLTYSPAR